MGLDRHVTSRPTDLPVGQIELSARQQIVGWLERFAKPIAVVHIMMGIASASLCELHFGRTLWTMTAGNRLSAASRRRMARCKFDIVGHFVVKETSCYRQKRPSSSRWFRRGIGPGRIPNGIN
jgi:hypothetical protein